MRTFALHALILVLAFQPAFAQDGPLEMIPSSVAVLVRLQAPEKVTEDLTAFIDKVQPGFGGFAAAQLPSVFGQAAFNPTLAGVDQTRDWYVAWFVTDDQKMKSVLLLPTTDIAEVKEAMGPTFEFAEKENWLACCKQEQYRDEFQSCLDGKAESIASKFDERTTSTLMSGHLGVAVHAAVLKEAFAEELGSAEGRLEDLIQAMGQQMRATNPDMELDYVFDVYRDMGKVLLQAVQDSESAVIAVKVTESAVEIAEIVTVELDSKTDQFFLTQPVSEMARLTSLPEGLTGYMGIHGDPAVLLTWSERMMSCLFKDEELKEKMLKSFSMMRDVKFGSIVAGGDLISEEEGALRYFGVSEIAPSSVIREAFQQFGPGIEYEIAGMKQKQSFELNAETIDGQSVDIYRMEQTIPPALDPTGMQKALNEKMYGPEGIVQRIVIQDGLLLQTMGGGSESMGKLLKAGSWSDSQLLDARSRLHKQANLLVLVDMPNMVQKFAKMVLESGAVPIPIQPEQLDNLVLNPSYAGFSMAVEKQRMTMQTSIPAETFQGFFQIGMFVQQLSMQGR